MHFVEQRDINFIGIASCFDEPGFAKVRLMPGLDN
jgi:hypothetical protein